MKTLLILVTLLISFGLAATPIDWSSNQYAKIVDIEGDIDAMEANSGISEAQLVGPAIDGLQASRLARVTYEPAVDGGATATTYSLGVTLPINSLIIGITGHVAAKLLAGNPGVQGYALGCSSPANLEAYLDGTRDLTNNSTDDLFSSSAILASATPDLFLTAACPLQISLDNGAAYSTSTSGKVVYFIEYSVSE